MENLDKCQMKQAISSSLTVSGSNCNIIPAVIKNDIARRHCQHYSANVNLEMYLSEKNVPLISITLSQ